MAVYGSLPQKNLQYSDIRDTLNAHGGTVSNDVSSAFKESAKINPWSKHKPVPLSASFCQDFDSGASNYNPNWWKGSKGNCGISFPEYTGYAQVIQGYDGDKNGWSHELPSGGSSEPFRLGDFSEYYPNAANPMGNMTVTPDEINSSESVNIRFEGIFTTWNEKGLRLADIGDLANRYCGAVVGKKDSAGTITGVGYITVDKKVSEIDVDSVYITFKYSWTAGKWVFFPVLCKNKQTTFGGTISNSFVPYTGRCSEVEVGASYGTTITISAYATQSTKQISWTAIFKSSTASAAAWNNIQIQLRSSSGGQFASSTLANISLGAGKSKSESGSWQLEKDWYNILNELRNNRLYVEVVCQASSGPSTKSSTVILRPE